MGPCHLAFSPHSPRYHCRPEPREDSPAPAVGTLCRSRRYDLDATPQGPSPPLPRDLTGRIVLS